MSSLQMLVHAQVPHAWQYTFDAGGSTHPVHHRGLAVFVKLTVALVQGQGRVAQTLCQGPPQHYGAQHQFCAEGVITATCVVSFCHCVMSLTLCVCE